MAVRVITWNLHGSARPPLDAVAAALERWHPDVVGLQEVRPGQARTLARRLGWRHRWVRKHLPYGPLAWWRAEGLAVLSPHDLDGNVRTVLNPTVSTFSYRRRVAQRSWLDLGEGDRIRIANVHLASDPTPDERVAQATVLAGLLAAEPAEIRRELLVTGDLNAVDEPATLAPLFALGLDDAWSEDAGPGPTNPSPNPYQRLDYVLVGSDWHVVGRQVADDPLVVPLSDHLPVIIDLVRSVPQTRSK